MSVNKSDYDAIVVGSGPNGLAAAVTLQQAGLSVLLLEAKETIGGGLRSVELTLPGLVHDVCSARHTMATSSPFFRTLPLQQHGLEFISPPFAAAHPFDDGTAAVLHHSMERTAAGLDDDASSYLNLMKPLLDRWPHIINDVLGPLHFPRHPVAMAQFGVKAVASAAHLVRRFHSKAARGLWAGMAAHSMQPLSRATTSAIALVLMLAGHSRGWPMAKGGSNAIAKALAEYFVSLGGTVETNFHVHSLGQLPSSRAILFDLTPRQLLHIAGHKFS